MNVWFVTAAFELAILQTETESEEIDSPEVERLGRICWTEIDEDSDLCTSIHDLDSFMKSFEEEITLSHFSHGSGAAEERIVESASDCGNPERLRKESSNWCRIPANRGRSRLSARGVGRRARDSTSGGVSGEEGAGDGVRRSVA
ncbi:hypothetical protein SASPL_157782 [Salvia splendens]|uniref:Uncharacterized protein n=1 Tax=Salvia splendens TaxID=180675 RepID=A0A8X8YUY5_SALSN|nr:hypothetical protein SASPL_157782 [Salvia splendens]